MRESWKLDPQKAFLPFFHDTINISNRPHKSQEKSPVRGLFFQKGRFQVKKDGWAAAKSGVLANSNRCADAFLS